MANQKPIDWDDASLRRHLEACEFWRTEIELVCLLNRCGRRTEGQGWFGLELTISRRKAGAAMGCSHTAVGKAAARLAERGLLAVSRIGATPTFTINLSRLAKLEPIAKADPFAPREEVETGNQWQPVETGGNRPRAYREGDKTISRAYRDRGARVSAPHLAQGAVSSGFQRLPVRLRDVSDENVRRLDLDVLLGAFDDATRCGWLDGEREDLEKFLAACHHAARTPQIVNPARVLYSAVKSYELIRPGVEAQAWAKATMKKILPAGLAEHGEAVPVSFKRP